MHTLHVRSCVSTMDEARAHWLEKGPLSSSWLLVRADEQTCGRGTWGRPWSSPKGNLYLTLSGRCDQSPQDLPQEVSNAIQEMLKARGLDVQRRGLNDLTIHGKKLCGALVEHWMCQGLSMISIGVGLNVAMAPDVPEQLTTCLVDWGWNESLDRTAELVTESLLQMLQRRTLYA
ncbi:MAG: biotin--[acetyl-CoA-carboxylase] ligase [Chlamydiia bacterium]